MNEPIQRKCYWCPLREIPLREISDCQHAQYAEYRWVCGKTEKGQYAGYRDCIARYGLFNESDKK